MFSSVAALKHRFYDDVPGRRSGTARYLELVDDYVRPGDRVLDIGPGDGSGFAHPLKGRVRELVGLDPAPGVVRNAGLDRGVVGTAEDMPFDDESFDACVCSFVLEHIAEPARVAREAQRVLRRGGVLILRTPNLWHYTSLIAHLTPHRFHRLVANRVRGLGAASCESHPTHHRCNTRRRLRRVFNDAGFAVERLTMLEPEPSYLQFARITFLLGVAYERLVSSCRLLAPFRVTIMAVLRKPEESHGAD